MKVTPPDARHHVRRTGCDQTSQAGRAAVVNAIGLALCAGLLWPAAACLAQATQPGLSDDDVQISPGETISTVIEVMMGRSRELRTKFPVKRVSITNPKVADVQVLNPRQVLVMGKTIGQTDLIVWSENEQPWQARVEVKADLEGLRTRLGELLAGSQLDLRQVNDAVVITGVVRRAEHTAQMHQLLEAAGVKYVDMAVLAGVQQVMIQVRIAEAGRTAIRALGINWFSTGNDFFGGSVIGPAGGGPINPINIGVPQGAAARSGVPFAFLTNLNVSPGVTLFAGIPDANLQFFIQALAENQYMRILAEPNLVALSGQEANFLAGGEFPIPVVQGGVGDSTAITIEYREFGVRLRFRPVVLGEGSINLHVAPEVSELSDRASIEIQGFSIPTILTRRAETTVELKDGQTFALAGLLSQATRARNSRVPLLGDLPVLGPLFRSVRYENGESELVVLVTARLVEPLSYAKKRPVPGDFHLPPSDWELYCCGRIEGRPAKLPPVAPPMLKRACLSRLCGPGAWASYEQAPAAGRSRLRPEPCCYPTTAADES